MLCIRVVCRDSQSRIWGGARGSYRKWRLTGGGPDRKWRHRTSHDRKWSHVHAQPVPALFPYYNSSTKCTIAHDRMWRHQTSRNSEGGSLGRVGCAHAQPEVAQYPIKRHLVGLPLENMAARMLDRKCPCGAL